MLIVCVGKKQIRWQQDIMAVGRPVSGVCAYGIRSAADETGGGRMLLNNPANYQPS